MKKKVLLSVVALVLVATAAIVGTLAWYSANDETTNVVTVGNLDAKIFETDEEDINDDTEWTDDGIDYEGLLPGTEAIKHVDIRTKGADALVRVNVDVVGPIIQDEEGNYNFLSDDDVAAIIGSLDITTDWELHTDGYYYYVGGAAGTPYKFVAGGLGVQGVTFFTKFEVPEEWDTDYADIEFEIVISLEAVQYDNLFTGSNLTDVAAAFADAGL